MSATLMLTLVLAAPPNALSPELPATKPKRYLVTQSAPQPVVPPSSELSDAEKIARANRLIETGKADLKTLEAELLDPDSEYARAEKEFQELDEKFKGLTKEIETLKADNHLEDAAKKETELGTLKPDWETARDRFDLAIRQRKTVMEKIGALKAQIQRGQQWLATLEGTSTEPENPPNSTPPATALTKTPPTTETTPAATPAEKPPVAAIPIPGMVIPPSTPATPPANGTDPDAVKPVDPEIIKARERVEQRLEELKQATVKAKTADERLAAIQKHIEIENRLLAVEREAADKAGLLLSRITQQLAVEAPTDPDERAKLEDKLGDANRRLTEANDRIKQINDRLKMHNESLRALQQRRNETLLEAELKKQEAETAAADLTEMLNPLASRNVQKWCSEHGPDLVAIASGMLCFYLLIRTTSRRIVKIIADRNNRGSDTDRDNRVNTLVGVFRSLSTMAIFGGGSLIFLDEAGVPVVPLMGGAAVLGLAVAFGAQNLIKDYFTGFMILMEDQYGVNDVVRIGGIAGQVERLTPRVTVLRDLEGILHFIPHGTIANVSNLTHTWSRAVFDIPVSYDADLERAMHAMMEIAHEMRSDPGFGGDVIDEPEMLGVDAYGESGMIVRFILKTRPLRQWAVKREMLRRIKHRFDQIGISIPYPHRTIYHKFPDGVPGAVPQMTSSLDTGFEAYRKTG